MQSVDVSGRGSASTPEAGRGSAAGHDAPADTRTHASSAASTPVREVLRARANAWSGARPRSPKAGRARHRHAHRCSSAPPKDEALPRQDRSARDHRAMEKSCGHVAYAPPRAYNQRARNADSPAPNLVLVARKTGRVQGNQDYKRRGRDSNPRRTKPPLTVFKTVAFNRSATPPWQTDPTRPSL